ncbi:MAG: class I SAM-dependent methyltransferase [Alphaproteobacteria bacterium]
MNEHEKTDLEEYLNFLSDGGYDVDHMVACYLTVLDDTVNEQLYFAKERRYRHSSFSEVKDSVYFNESYMEKYMVGLAITSFLWPNHSDIRRFFLETMPLDVPGDYLEVGPGHGYFFITAIRRSSFRSFTGIDISPTSITLTRRAVEYFVPDRAPRVHLQEQDFLGEMEGTPRFDAIVMGEVLEHVENPGTFLRRIGELARESSYVFLTTCINAPAIDHIHLFRNEREIRDLITKAGLSVRDLLEIPYHGKSLVECRRDDLPVNVAYVLDKLQ